MTRSITQIVILTLCTFGIPAESAVQTFTNKQAWQSAVGAHTTITFQEFPTGTLITNQYDHLGVLFIDGSDFVLADNGFLNDGIGLYGNIDFTTIIFDQPTTAIAVDYPGGAGFQLFHNGNVFFEFFTSPGGAGQFLGLVSNQSFDKVRIFDDVLYIDDLHFGPPIPAPAVGALFMFAVAATRGWRRAIRT